MINTICLGFQQATCIIVGNLIGADNIPLAKRMAKLIAIQTICCAIAISALTYSYRKALTKMFTTKEGEELSKIVSAIPVLLCITS